MGLFCSNKANLVQMSLTNLTSLTNPTTLRDLSKCDGLICLSKIIFLRILKQPNCPGKIFSPKLPHVLSEKMFVFLLRKSLY